MADASPVVAVTPEQLKEILQSVRGGGGGDQAVIDAIRQSRQPIPENFNLPPSDKPAPKCEKMMVWGYPVGMESKEEMEMLNRLEPGQYTITKADETKLKVEVTAKYDDRDGHMVELLLAAKDVSEGWTRNMLPMKVYLKEILDQQEAARDQRAFA